MCTVKGDIHDIGKNLVIMMLEGAGFEVIDLGVDLVDQLIARVGEIQLDILGLSALKIEWGPSCIFPARSLEKLLYRPHSSMRASCHRRRLLPDLAAQDRDQEKEADEYHTHEPEDVDVGHGPGLLFDLSAD
jgi:cobalamin-dependent methionine synthase I